MYEPFTVAVERGDGVARVLVAGELDLATVPELEARLPAPSPGETLVLDLRELAFIDSSGIRVLMRLDLDSRERGWTLVVVRARPSVQRVLDLVRLGDRIRLVDEPAEV